MIKLTVQQDVMNLQKLILFLTPNIDYVYIITVELIHLYSVCIY